MPLASQRTLSLDDPSWAEGAGHQEVHLGVEGQEQAVGDHPIASAEFFALAL